ncbi:EF-hand domain-containing family member C2 [Blattella germanica]|nr:EF-hand domain-containing family member C2 [Blattella germanica]
MITEKNKPGIGGAPLPYTKPQKYPSLYSRGEIYLFMEDGTIQVLEPAVDNSGIPQGTLISRQRIRFPAPRDEDFYDILDFNVGREVELYGRVFKITNCDRYTRHFLNRLGIHVPDPVDVPPDPYTEQQKKLSEGMLPKKPNKHIDTLGQFLEFDRKVLRFYGYWDDRENPHGIFHELEVHYYLADDTIEIKEIIPPNAGRDYGFMFLHRSKLPKIYKNLPLPGYDDPHTVLNVLPIGFLKGRYLVDALNCGQEPVEYYKDCDLAIGTSINDFQPHERPQVQLGTVFKLEPPPLPPYNGYGSYEDSAANCRNVIPIPPHRDFRKFLSKDRQGLDSYVLRFKAELISKIPSDKDRRFIISYFLCDDTISVFETPLRNSGFIGGEFIKRTQIPKPGQEIFTSNPPDHYTQEDFFIGNILTLCSFEFILVDADEYALRYMEVHSDEFPKSNIILIVNKIREALKPIYKQFVCEYLKTDPNQIGNICYTKMSKVLKEIMGDNITHHELITLARHYNARCIRDPYPKETLRGIVHNELKRLLFNAMERLHESFLLKDPNRSGFVSRNTAYAVCRGAKLPIDKDLLESVLDKICKNEAGLIDYRDLLGFLDLKQSIIFIPCSET